MRKQVLSCLMAMLLAVACSFVAFAEEAVMGREMTEIVADSVVVVPYLESKQITVSVLPAAASAGARRH